MSLTPRPWKRVGSPTGFRQWFSWIKLFLVNSMSLNGRIPEIAAFFHRWIPLFDGHESRSHSHPLPWVWDSQINTQCNPNPSEDSWLNPKNPQKSPQARWRSSIMWDIFRFPSWKRPFTELDDGKMYGKPLYPVAMENPPIVKFGKPSISMGSKCHFARPWTRWTRSASTHAAPSRAPGRRWPSAGGPGLFGPAGGGGGRIFHPWGSWCPPSYTLWLWLT